MSVQHHIEQIVRNKARLDFENNKHKADMHELFPGLSDQGYPEGSPERVAYEAEAGQILTEQTNVH